VAPRSLFVFLLAIPLLAQSPDLQPGERDVSLNVKKFAQNFFSDQKKIWTSPVKLGQGEHWKPTLAVTGITAGLIAADAPVASFVKRRRDRTAALIAYSRRITPLPRCFSLRQHFMLPA